jgi:hypothetical protein
MSLYLSVLKVNPARRLYDGWGLKSLKKRHITLRCNFMPLRNQKQELAKNVQPARRLLPTCYRI